MMAALTRSASNVLCINRLSSPVIHQVRFKRREPLRKLLWLPMAPSKLFKINPRPQVTQSDEERLLREKLNFDYQAALCSIREYCHQHFYLPAIRNESEIESMTELEKKAQEALQDALRKNDEENKRVAALRAKRREIELAEFAAHLIEEDNRRQQKQLEFIERAKENVEIETKRSSSFITKDKLAQAIEEALLNPVHYEWAIDRQGKVYYDGSIHPNAFTPSAVPETSNHKDLAMKELPKSFRLKAHKLY